MIGRRGFLAGIGALLAAPAIVRPGLLMPIKPFVLMPEYAPILPVEVLPATNALLTPSIIAREAAVLLKQRLAEANPLRIQSTGPVQLHVDFLHTSQDLVLSLHEFSERFIKPAIHLLADALSPTAKINSELLEVPKGVEGASERYDGAALRFIRAYNVETDSLISRFDVRAA